MKNRYILVLFLSFFVSTIAVGQETKLPKRILEDSTYQAMLREESKRRLENQQKWRAMMDSLNSDSLTILDGQRLKLTELPDLTRFVRLKTIRLQSNELEIIPMELLKADSLTHLHLDQNKLTHIKFPRNPSVKVLTMNQNKITKIPRSIRKLKNLKVLDLESNNIQNIPRFLVHMDSLEELNLNFNELQLSKKSFRRLKKIKKLSLGGNKLQSLPENVSDLKRVTHLNLGRNQLSCLPASLVKLRNLEQIVCYKNNFNTFPDVLTKMPSLVEIDLYYNNIETLPTELGQLKSLKRLFLSYNKIQSLPDSLGALTALRYLYVHNNRLTVFPHWVASHPQLQRVGFGKNRIINLPDLNGMKSLTDLDVQANLIDRFPWELLDKEGMELLILKDNDFKLTNEEMEELKSREAKLDAKGFRIVY